jgi:hypothetical protein
VYLRVVASDADLVCEFVTQYEIELLSRVQRANYELVLGYPGAAVVDRQWEKQAGAIVGVRPATGPSWIGVFSGSYDPSAVVARPQVICWPDGRSLCGVAHGNAAVVRSDDPYETYEIDAFPITGVLVVSRHKLVLFCDFTDLYAYGESGCVWHTGRIAEDGLQIVRVKGDYVFLRGGVEAATDISFRVNLRTGISPDHTY